MKKIKDLEILPRKLPLLCKGNVENGAQNCHELAAAAAIGLRLKKNYVGLPPTLRTYRKIKSH